MIARIQEELRRLEVEQGLRVLYACESGSRAWGFESVDSDWDVRFFYVRPRDWYLAIRDRRDVVEAMLPDDLDLAGWDLRKTLGLLLKSNPSLVEWLASPIVYAQDDAFMAEFRALAQGYISTERSFRHYLHMAQGNWRAYLQDEQVPRKKYLYVLRPVYACRWLEAGLGSAPMEFDRLRAGVPGSPETEAQVDALLAEKRAGSELGLSPRLSEIHAFLEAELLRLGELDIRENVSPDEEPLNEFFRRWVG
ncbi:MAG: DNA polymerase beta superfamily protein [Fimbriimonas sp.]